MAQGGLIAQKLRCWFCDRLLSSCTALLWIPVRDHVAERNCLRKIVLISGFWGADLGWTLPASFSANSPSYVFFLVNLLALFLRGCTPPPPPRNSCPKFTPKIVCIPPNFRFLKPRFFHAEFLLTGKTKIITQHEKWYENRKTARIQKMIRNVSETC